MARDDAGLFEQPHGPVNRGDGNVRIDLVGAAIEFFHIGVVVGSRQHPRDHAALLGHAHALLDAEIFNAIHERGSSDFQTT